MSSPAKAVPPIFQGSWRRGLGVAAASTGSPPAGAQGMSSPARAVPHIFQGARRRGRWVAAACAGSPPVGVQAP